MIFVAIPTHFREMIRVARLLRTSRRFEPHVIFSVPYSGQERDEETCRKEGIGVFVLFAESFRWTWLLDPQREEDESPAVLVEGSGTNGSQPQGKGDIRVVSADKSGANGPRRKHIRPTQRLPLFLQPSVRRVWQSIYRTYWRARMRHSVLLGPIWWRIIIFSRVALNAFSAVLSGVDKRNIRRDGIGATSSTVFGRSLVRAFADLWERGSLPGSLREKQYLYRALPNFFRKQRFELLIVPEDNYFLDTHFFVYAARRVGAASIVVPFTVVNSLEWAETFHGRPAYSVRWPPNSWMARAFPHWVYEHKGQKMIMPALLILMSEYLGLTPPKPWVINSGFTDALAAESVYMVNYYREAGINEHQIALTGSLADDELHLQVAHASEKRESLYKSLGLPTGRPMILISIPPNQLIGDGRTQCEFSNYETLIKAILDVTCACEDHNVVLSLHPRINHGDITCIGAYSAKVTQESIASVIPLCEFFVASASATIRLAAAAGKPAINYDVYRYQYTDFLNIPGVIAVNDIDAFKTAVDSIAQNTAYREELARKQREFAAHQALIDGHSGERMLALFDRLTEKNRAPGTSPSVDEQRMVGQA
ncbi:MAG TPA: hypothetical protein VKS43_01780 [Burkholderiales bacterium]|nr:hypothetical protein [Burkholderiales bacterium]